MQLSRIMSIAALGSALLLSACKSPCRQLAEQLCECEDNTLDKEACLQEVSRKDAFYQPDAAAQDQCQAILDAESCDCTQIETTEGKRACGLAR